MSCFTTNQMIQMMFKNPTLQPNSLVMKLLSGHYFKVIFNYIWHYQ